MWNWKSTPLGEIIGRAEVTQWGWWDGCQVRAHQTTRSTGRVVEINDVRTDPLDRIWCLNLFSLPSHKWTWIYMGYYFSEASFKKHNHSLENLEENHKELYDNETVKYMRRCSEIWVNIYELNIRFMNRKCKHFMHT